ncbi:hypothetical protein PoB_005542200 [Plakobranchus ocellatus]|uniref:Uncharacterized protein n=1 Tax=Plakobranchus ocellatus TaxID=259542 RepID=A0AAV4CBJ7_9GAST|nr:hypothetical protein PoB_005542200 [Plakobranchus ocellatus]
MIIVMVVMGIVVMIVLAAAAAAAAAAAGAGAAAVVAFPPHPTQGTDPSVNSPPTTSKTSFCIAHPHEGDFKLSGPSNELNFRYVPEDIRAGSQLIVPPTPPNQPDLLDRHETINHKISHILQFHKRDIVFNSLTLISNQRNNKYNQQSE